MLSRYMTWWSVSASVIWASAIVCDPNAMYATPLRTVAEFFNYSRPALVFALLTSAFSTVVAMLPASRLGLRTLILLIPQQFFLCLAAGGSVMAIYSGHYADGVLRSQAFILADQSPWVLAALLYTVSVVNDFRRRAWIRIG